MESIWTMGEILVEIMRPRAGMGLRNPGAFLGPFPSGAPAIFIDTVARLGHPAGMIGGIGEDDFGRCLVERLEKDGVDCRYVRRFAGSTAVAFVSYDSDGSRQFIFHIDGTPAVQQEYPGVLLKEAPAFFHIMGCSLMANDAFQRQIIRAMEDFASKGAKISFDPNIRPELLRGRSLDSVAGPVLEICSVLLPGEKELALLAGTSDITAAASNLFRRFPLEWMVVKQGQSGCKVFARNGKYWSIPAYPVEEVDPTGAGDCFDAGFLCGLVEDLPPEQCARYGAAAGAINAAAFGPMEGKISRAAVQAIIEGRGTITI